MEDPVKIDSIIAIAKKAGQLILEVYDNKIAVELKEDSSPLTKADQKAHHYIANQLAIEYPSIPLLSEENPENHDYAERKNWNIFWMIDPLDGTKEFIKKNGEFTVNIALIEKNKPVLGVVYAPAKELLYYGSTNGSFKKVKDQGPIKLPSNPAYLIESTERPYRVVGSRSHPSEDFKEYVNSFKKGSQQYRGGSNR